MFILNECHCLIQGTILITQPILIIVIIKTMLSCCAARLIYPSNIRSFKFVVLCFIHPYDLILVTLGMSKTLIYEQIK